MKWRITLVALLAAAMTMTSTAVDVLNGPAEAAPGHYQYHALGADSFCAPSLAAMSEYFIQSPYYWWGIYIGGENKGCSTGVAKSWVNGAIAQGWGLMPIWVGPQAPCVNQAGLSHFSSNTTDAFNRGETEASAAYGVAVNTMGLTAANLPIAYDMEAFDTGNSTCLAAVKAFMRGWDTILAAAPAQDAGYYGSYKSSDPSAIWSISPHPGFLWGADPDGVANTSMTPSVSDSIFPHRIKQYGSGTLAVGGYQNSIDKNCASGPMYGTTAQSVGC